MFQLQLIGGGRMGEALLGGLLAGDVAAGDVHVVEAVPARREELAARFAGLSVGADPVEAAGTIIEAKPGDVPAACRAAASAGDGRVLSIAAGVTPATLEAELGDGQAVVRAMQNTPSLESGRASD